MGEGSLCLLRHLNRMTVMNESECEVQTLHRFSGTKGQGGRLLDSGTSV